MLNLWGRLQSLPWHALTDTLPVLRKESVLPLILALFLGLMTYLTLALFMAFPALLVTFTLNGRVVPLK